MVSTQTTDKCHRCKTHVPLTDQEIDRIRADCVLTPHEYRDRAYGWALHFARAVERAHGIEEKK